MGYPYPYFCLCALWGPYLRFINCLASAEAAHSGNRPYRLRYSDRSPAEARFAVEFDLVGGYSLEPQAISANIQQATSHSFPLCVVGWRADIDMSTHAHTHTHTHIYIYTHTYIIHLFYKYIHHAAMVIHREVQHKQPAWYSVGICGPFRKAPFSWHRRRCRSLSCSHRCGSSLAGACQLKVETAAQRQSH